MLSPATQYEWKTRSLRPDGRADAPVFSTLARRDPWTVFARGSATQYSRPLKAHCASAHTRTLLYEQPQMRRAIQLSALSWPLLAACTEAPTPPERTRHP